MNGTRARNEARIRNLRVAIKLMLLVAGIAVAWVLLAFVFGGHKDLPARQAMTLSLEGIDPGEAQLVDWNGQAVVVLHRSDAEIATLPVIESALLADPEGARSHQPAWADSPWRSREPGWFVGFGVGGEMGCPLVWQAGGEFTDSCSGTRYDAAGRVFAGQSVSRNLEVPVYRIEGGMLTLLDTVR